jgi:DNA polymerase III delta prime subunit
MKELLLSEKWRPKKFEDAIILPRIQKIFEKGITQNVILCGSFGTGKTTLSRILIGRYLKNRPNIELNGSLYTSIDVLRTKIDDFCSKVYMGLDLTNDYSDMESIKYVFIDECDRLSIQFQDALKAYIEEYSAKNVRFIFTTNHINKVSPGILSRLQVISFDCENAEEEKILKQAIAKRLMSVIAPAEQINIGKDTLIKIINKNFPDFRSMMNDLQVFKETGDLGTGVNNVNIKLRNELYSMVYDNVDYEYIYHFLMDKFGAEKIDEMIGLFGSQFIKYSFSEKRENIDKLFEVNNLVAEYNRLLDSSTDPIVLGMSFMGKLKKLFN